MPYSATLMRTTLMRWAPLLPAFLLLISSFQNCADKEFHFNPVENEAMKASPFAASGDPSQISGVIPGADGLPTNAMQADLSSPAVQPLKPLDCLKPVTLDNGQSVPRREWERQQSLNEVAADSTHKTIPVKFDISFGNKEDVLALWANKRAILSGNNPGYSYIPVGGKTSTSNGTYYKVSHDRAKSQFLNNERCFFSTVQIEGDLITGPSEPWAFIANDSFTIANKTPPATEHLIEYMYYGWCDPSVTGDRCASQDSRYGPGNFGESEVPNRLFGTWPHYETVTTTNSVEPQFVNLYIADIRGREVCLGNNETPLLVDQSTVRGLEQSVTVRSILNMPSIQRDFHQVARCMTQPMLSKDPSTETSYPTSLLLTGSTMGVFAPMGNPLTVLTFLFSMAGGVNDEVVISTQYTPIVLDLGAEKILTTSLEGGTYFNMAALKRSDLQGLDAYDVPHKTAWLGGALVNFAKQVSDGLNLPYDFRPVIEDGFLVIPDGDGKVRSSLNMFGDHTVVYGRTYSNGFEALRALAGKDCNSSDVTKIYFGPWDGDLYATTVKVWVDANGNGVADPGELKSLSDVGVIAINTCNVVSSDAVDPFGNGTSMRSAFLYRDPKTISPLNPVDVDSVIHQLETGYVSDGVPATFRLAVDIVFKVDQQATLVELNK
ncbi:MAG: hypothetical protein C5B49_14920 [Bdellovibrio sp.]|nr:MAG: hypothetical protein C5B49_14920 [Bdellovibrio sp.]